MSRRRKASHAAKDVGGPPPPASHRLVKHIRNGLLILVLTLLPFVIAECVLAMMGVRPILYEEDPYVGFSSHIPLFVEETGADGTAYMVTAENKRVPFNLQRFPRDKARNAFRVFCMGGSTTYGRPYNDQTSFCGWLRAMLPECDPSRQWELINAGGVSYASYRVAQTMEELVRYQPDLFIIYTGHNEFLENRTYGPIRQQSSFMRELRVLLCRTRVFAALWRARSNMEGPSIGGSAAQPDHEGGVRTLLPSEVDTILEHSMGPEAYHRDDELQREIIAHFRFNLNRMIDIARSVDARVIFVTPASNLRDCTPFKSESRAGLNKAERDRFQTLYQSADHAFQSGQFDAVLSALDEASKIDDRYAGLHYLRGRALYALGRYDEAKEAFVRARDEDVCPLRALTPMVRVVADVAQKRDIPLVDAVGLMERLSEHGIPGDDVFFDHVHPTIESHRQLALAILDTMKQQGIVHPTTAWNEDAIQAVKHRIEDAVDPEAHGLALRNLSMVLRWAGKTEEADRLAQRATELVPDDALAHAQRGSTAETEGRIDEAIREYRRAIELNPDLLEAHFGLADILSSQGKYEEAVSEYHEALRIDPGQPAVYANLGTALGALGHVDEAAAVFHRAIEIKPDDGAAHYNLGNLLRRTGRFAEAADEYEKTLRISPYSEDARLHYSLARVLVELNRYDAALDHFQQAAQLAPQQPAVLQGLASCLLMSPNHSRNEAAQALAVAKQADELTGHENPVVLDTLAAAYAATGNFEEAVLVQRQALVRVDNSKPARLDEYRSHLESYERRATGDASP